MCCSDRCEIQRYKTYGRCDDVTSLTWRCVSVMWPSAHLLPGVQHAQFGALLLGVHQHVEHGADRQRHPEVRRLTRFLHFGIKCRFCSVGQEKKKVFMPEIWALGASQVRNESHLCLLKSFITGGAYLWVFTGLYSVFVALKGLPVVGVRHKNKDKDRARWIQTDVGVLIQLWWPLSLTSWRRPPSCRWPSVWVSAPDVWRTRAPASGGPARTSAEHPASRTNPRRWPSRYCREDEERD